jgi:hypothetical protein
VFGEVFEAFDRPKAEAPEQRQHCVAQGGEHLWGISGVGAP